MKLWVDDVRIPPQGEGWTWVSTYEDAILLVDCLSDSITEMSLDHDLGGDYTGYDLVKHMAEFDLWPTCSIRVHSMNPVGANNMRAIIKRYFNPIEEEVP